MITTLKGMALAVMSLVIGFLYMWLVVAIEGNSDSETVRFLVWFFLSLGFIVSCAKRWRSSRPDWNRSAIGIFGVQYPLILIISFELLSILPISIVFKSALSVWGGFLTMTLWQDNQGLKGLIQRLNKRV